MSGRIKVEIQGARGQWGPAYGGAATIQHKVETRYSDSEVDRLYGAEPENIDIAPGTFDLDLQTIGAGPDAALQATSVRALLIEADADNTGDVRVQPAAADPWLGAFTSATSVLRLGPGDFFALGGSDFPVSPTSKVLTLTNPTGSNQRVRVRILAAK